MNSSEKTIFFKIDGLGVNMGRFTNNINRYDSGRWKLDLWTPCQIQATLGLATMSGVSVVGLVIIIIILIIIIIIFNFTIEIKSMVKQ